MPGPVPLLPQPLPNRHVLEGASLASLRRIQGPLEQLVEFRFIAIAQLARRKPQGNGLVAGVTDKVRGSFMAQRRDERRRDHRRSFQRKRDPVLIRFDADMPKTHGKEALVTCGL